MGWFRLGRLAVATATAFLAGGTASIAQSSQQIPQFRAGVALTRLEVHVIDKTGSPVTDLTAADFSVREDGVPQEIALFQAVAMGDEPGGPPRSFVFVLGSGQLDAPTRAIQVLANFVRTKCRPSDRVGVVTYMRAIELTTNHEAVARFLEAFQNSHQAIDDQLRSGDGPDRPVNPHAVASINALFRDEGLRVRDLAGSQGAPPYFFYDATYLSRALEYLGLIEGEKHVVLVSERPFIGVRMPKATEDYWIRRAAGARSALSFFNAGGVRVNRGVSTRPDLRFNPPLGFDPGLIDDHQWLAEQTGGTATFFEFADKPLAALDRTTRFHYVFGYYPAQEVTPHQYRTIDIEVRRPGVALQYRHVYQAQPVPDSPEDYRRAITEARLADRARRLITPVPSIPGKSVGLSLKVLDTRLPAPERVVRVTVTVDPTWVFFSEKGGQFVAELDLVLLADDERRNIVGRHEQRIPIVLTAEQRDRLRSRWRPQSMAFDVDLTVSGRPAWIRGVLYQFESDRTGSFQLRLPQ